MDIESNIDAMIDGIRHEIEFVEELRIKTIADVVTGQVDVRGVVIPDYTVEEETEDDVDSEEIDDTAEESDAEEE